MKLYAEKLRSCDRVTRGSSSDDAGPNCFFDPELSGPGDVHCAFDGCNYIATGNTAWAKFCSHSRNAHGRNYSDCALTTLEREYESHGDRFAITPAELTMVAHYPTNPTLFSCKKCSGGLIPKRRCGDHFEKEHSDCDIGNCNEWVVCKDHNILRHNRKTQMRLEFAMDKAGHQPHIITESHGTTDPALVCVDGAASSSATPSGSQVGAMPKAGGRPRSPEPAFVQELVAFTPEASTGSGQMRLPDGMSVPDMHRLVAAELALWASKADYNTAMAYRVCADTLLAHAASGPLAPYVRHAEQSTVPAGSSSRVFQRAPDVLAQLPVVDVDFFSDPWLLRGRDQDAFPFPAIALKDEVSASSASDKFMADCDGNLRNPFLGIATNYEHIGFQSWLCTTKANISEATASGHALTLNYFLGLFNQTTDEANLVHFLRGLEESRVLQTLFRSWRWNAKMTWAQKRCVTLIFFAGYQASESHRAKRLIWEGTCNSLIK